MTTLLFAMQIKFVLKIHVEVVSDEYLSSRKEVVLV